MAHITVYIAPNCLGCGRTAKLIRYIRETYRGDTTVTVRDVTIGSERLPDDLFAVPAWYTDDVLFSLGNPTVEELDALLVNDDSP